MNKPVRLTTSSSRRAVAIATAGLTTLVCAAALALLWPHPADAAPTQAQQTQEAGHKPKPDLSGRARTGIASFYAKYFFGRTMADGTPMDPHGDNAASRTLPLGTTARVTNLETGKSAVVTIQDRGPYVDGRIVDLSPATARAIGLTVEQGLARVEVAPIAVPLPDGGVRLGQASDDEKTQRVSER